MWLLFSLLTTPMASWWHRLHCTMQCHDTECITMHISRVQWDQMHLNGLQHCRELYWTSITVCRGAGLTQKGLKMQLYSVNWQEMIRGLHIDTFLLLWTATAVIECRNIICGIQCNPKYLSAPRGPLYIDPLRKDNLVRQPVRFRPLIFYRESHIVWAIVSQIGSPIGNPIDWLLP